MDPSSFYLAHHGHDLHKLNEQRYTSPEWRHRVELEAARAPWHKRFALSVRGRWPRSSRRVVQVATDPSC